MRRCAGADVGEFARESWGRSPLLTRQASATGFDDLLSLGAVDELLSRRGLRTPFLRVVKDGSPIEASRYTRAGGVGAEIADQVADDLVLKLILDGATLVLQGLHRIWPPIIDFAGQLSDDLGHPVQVNAYVTPAASQGFAAHYDVHDVFVLQLAGRKRWVVHPPVLALPLRSQPGSERGAEVTSAASGRAVLDEVLCPGDALYLPRGFVHSARALGEVSAHLTVGLHPVTRYAIVEALAALAADEPALRESLPLGIDIADPVALAGEVEHVVRVLTKCMENAAPERIASRLRSVVSSATRPAPVAPLSQVEAIEALGPNSMVRRRPHLRHQVRQDGELVMLDLADRVISLPKHTAPALVMLLAGPPIALADLPALDPADSQVLVRRLLREAVVVPAS